MRILRSMIRLGIDLASSTFNLGCSELMSPIYTVIELEYNHFSTQITTITRQKNDQQFFIRLKKYHLDIAYCRSYIMTYSTTDIDIVILRSLLQNLDIE